MSFPSLQSDHCELKLKSAIEGTPYLCLTVSLNPPYSPPVRSGFAQSRSSLLRIHQMAFDGAVQCCRQVAEKFPSAGTARPRAVDQPVLPASALAPRLLVEGLGNVVSISTPSLFEHGVCYLCCYDLGCLYNRTLSQGHLHSKTYESPLLTQKAYCDFLLSGVLGREDLRLPSLAGNLAQNSRCSRSKKIPQAAIPTHYWCR